MNHAVRPGTSTWVHALTEAPMVQGRPFVDRMPICIYRNPIVYQTPTYITDIQPAYTAHTAYTHPYLQLQLQLQLKLQLQLQLQLKLQLQLQLHLHLHLHHM